MSHTEQEITIRWIDSGEEYTATVASGSPYYDDGNLITEIDDRIFYWLDDSELPLKVGQIIASEAEVVAL
jgi:hypothetical protein